MRISDFFSNAGSVSNTFNLTAGAAIAQSDLVAISSDGKGYPCKVSDYAAAANVGQVVASTTFGATGSPQSQDARMPALRDAQQNIYTAAYNTGTNGLKVFKYSPQGGLLASRTLQSANPFYTAKMFYLANGNIAVVASFNTVGIFFWILDPSLNLIAGPTAVEIPNTWSSYGMMDAVPLNAGGFAVVYQQNANINLQRLAIYDNAGVVVQAPKTIYTSAGTGTNVISQRILCNSAGNIVVFTHDMLTGVQNLYHSQWSPAGAQVLAPALLESGIVVFTPGEAIAGIGFYMFARGNGTQLKVRVFNDAGAVQGAPYIVAATAYYNNVLKALYDGVQFLLVWDDGTARNLLKAPTTGTNYLNIVLALTSQGGTFIDAALINGNIFAITGPANPVAVACKYWVVDPTGKVLVDATAYGPTPATDSGRQMTLLAGSDFTFTAVNDYGTNSGNTAFYVGKYQTASIVGVSTIAAAANSAASLSQAVGTYPVNNLYGSLMKSFDHTSGATIYGNKGILMPNGVVLKGM